MKLSMADKLDHEPFRSFLSFPSDQVEKDFFKSLLHYDGSQGNFDEKMELQASPLMQQEE
jgi:hypothetical protein